MSDAFLLDTSVTSVLFHPGHQHHQQGTEFLKNLSGEGHRIVLSTIALAEHECGFAQAELLGRPVSAERLEQTRAFYKSFEMLDFDADTIEVYAIVRAELFVKYATRKGRKFKERLPEELQVSGRDLGIQERDLLIAAIAIQYNVVLTTFDDGEGMRAIAEAADAAAQRGRKTRLRWHVIRRLEVAEPDDVTTPKPD